MTTANQSRLPPLPRNSHIGDLVMHDVEWVPVPVVVLDRMRSKTRSWPLGMRQVVDGFLRDCQGYSVEIDADQKWTLTHDPQPVERLEPITVACTDV